MMFNRRVAIGTLVGVGLLAMSGWAAAAIVADGALGDWGVVISTGATNTVSGGNTYQGSGPSPKYGTTNYAGVITSSSSLSVATSIEDTNDLKNGYYLGPNSGGQNYDVEFMGVGIDSSYLYIAIMTGQRPDNRFRKYSPGDIRIETDSDVFGLEVGGGWGVGELGYQTANVMKGDLGATYDLNSGGFTEAVVRSDGSTAGTFDPGALTMLASQKAGTLWNTAAGDWINDPINPPTPTQFNTLQIGGGTLVGEVEDYIYRFNEVSPDPDLGAHGVIEAKIPLSLFGDGATVTSVDWSPSCGNDTLSVDVPSAPGVIPEPASVMVWCGLALVGLVAGKRRAAARFAV